jgi:hypothetical protein
MREPLGVAARGAFGQKGASALLLRLALGNESQDVCNGRCVHARLPLS